MKYTIDASTPSMELPEFAQNRDALLGFRVDIATGRSALVIPTRASSTERRQAA